MKFEQPHSMRVLCSGAFCSCGTVLRDLKKYEFDLPSIIWQGGYIKWNTSHFKGYITKNFYTLHQICIHCLIYMYLPVCFEAYKNQKDQMAILGKSAEFTNTPYLTHGWYFSNVFTKGQRAPPPPHTYTCLEFFSSRI